MPGCCRVGRSVGGASVVRFVGGISCEDTAVNVHKPRTDGRERRKCLGVVALRGRQRDRPQRGGEYFHRRLGDLLVLRRGVSCEDTCAARLVRGGVVVWDGMFPLPP